MNDTRKCQLCGGHFPPLQLFRFDADHYKINTEFNRFEVCTNCEMKLHTYHYKRDKMGELVERRSGGI
jgi:hypothetical protein